jgi:hypothetical protein
MKPVAYITKYDLERLPLYDCWVNGEKSKGSIPLYTHPVKELTDDEIVNIGTEFLAPKDCDIYTFARAILRKASAK